MLAALEAIGFPDLNGYAIWPNEVSKKSQSLPDPEWGLLMLMSSHAQQGDDPTIEQLALERLVTVRTIHRRAALLVEQGWLVRDSSVACGYAMGPQWNRIMVPILLEVVRNAGALTEATK